jgi:hypothetical protein
MIVASMIIGGWQHRRCAMGKKHRGISDEVLRPPRLRGGTIEPQPPIGSLKLFVADEAIEFSQKVPRRRRNLNTPQKLDEVELFYHPRANRRVQERLKAVMGVRAKKGPGKRSKAVMAVKVVTFSKLTNGIQSLLHSSNDSSRQNMRMNLFEDCARSFR